MESKPSLISLYQTIVRLAKEEGYASPEEMAKHSSEYAEKMKKSENVKYDEKFGIISQYGGGYMSKPGSYDRYVPFKNFPDANFLVIAWPIGILQASCNPFKKERTLKGVNLGEIAQDVLKKHEDYLKNSFVTLERVKYAAEIKAKEDSVGFTFNDLVAIYGDSVIAERNGKKFDWKNEVPPGSKSDYTVDRWISALKSILSRTYSELDKSPNKKQIMDVLSMLKISWWDVIQANSGGHKCITNISGLHLLGEGRMDLLKNLQKDLVEELQKKIAESN